MYLQDDNIETAIEYIKDRSGKLNVSPLDFFELVLIMYKTDAGSYTEDAGGKNSLDHLFEFGETINFSDATAEKIEKLRSALEQRDIRAQAFH